MSLLLKIFLIFILKIYVFRSFVIFGISSDLLDNPLGALQLPTHLSNLTANE